MGWLLLVALGVIWAVFLVPMRKTSADRSIEDFERNMDLLADTEGNGRGRWIVTPRKGVAFVGTRERARERARARRRRVFVFMVESTGIAFLIGLVPPLRAMWLLAGSLMILLALYTWLLVTVKEREAQHPTRAPVAAVRANGSAHAGNGAARRPSNGHASNGHAAYRQASNGHAARNVRASTSHASNGNGSNGKGSNGRAVKSHAVQNGQVSNGQAANGEASNGHAARNGHANGHAYFDADEFVNIVVRPASERKRDAIERAGVAGI